MDGVDILNGGRVAEFGFSEWVLSRRFSPIGHLPVCHRPMGQGSGSRSEGWQWSKESAHEFGFADPWRQRPGKPCSLCSVQVLGTVTRLNEPGRCFTGKTMSRTAIFEIFWTNSCWRFLLTFSLGHI